jgi:hypothetical protein
MPHKAARPTIWDSRPGLDDLRVAAESEASLIQNPSHAQAQRRLRRQRHVQQVHRLGARVFFEFVDELDRVHGLGDDLDQRLEAFAALDPGLLAALGADRFPAAPLRLVGSAT